MIIKYNTRRLRKQCEICGVSVARLKGKQTLKMSTSVLVNPAEVRLLGRWPCGASSASSRRPCRSIHQVQNDATCTQCNLSSSSSLCRFFYLLRDKSSIVSVRPTICIFSIIWSKSDFSDTFFRKKKRRIYCRQIIQNMKSLKIRFSFLASWDGFIQVDCKIFERWQKI